MPKAKDGLSAKMKMFCQLYITCFNATQAAEDAGYSANNRKQLSNRANKLLNNQNVKEEITRLLSEKEEGLILKQDELMKYLSSVVRGEETEETPIKIKQRNKDDIIENHESKVKARDRLKAAELIAKIYQLMDLPREDSKTGDLNITVELID